jgi:hypothetical protein
MKKSNKKKGKITSVVCSHPKLGAIEFLVKAETGEDKNTIKFTSKVVNPN